MLIFTLFSFQGASCKLFLAREGTTWYFLQPSTYYYAKIVPKCQNIQKINLNQHCILNAL